MWKHSLNGLHDIKNVVVILKSIMSETKEISVGVGVSGSELTVVSFPPPLTEEDKKKIAELLKKHRHDNRGKVILSGAYPNMDNQPPQLRNWVALNKDTQENKDISYKDALKLNKGGVSTTSWRNQFRRPMSKKKETSSSQ